LLANAPHQVKPIPFVIPMFSGAARGRRKISIGLRLYQALDRSSTLPVPRMLETAGLLELEPLLSREGLQGGALYWDAQADFPERLVLECALDAHVHHATIVTHALHVAILRTADGVSGVEWETPAGSAEARAPLVINATGAWVDALLGSTARPLIGATRGTHLVVERWDGAPTHALYGEAPDHRPFFIIPWNGLLLIGTTDVPVAEPPQRVEPEQWEVAYLLGAANTLLSEHRVRHEDICYTFAGLRPLPFATDGSPGRTTRRHTIVTHDGSLRGVISVVGGKITSHRRLAEEVVTSACTTTDCRPSDTCNAPLPGAVDLPSTTINLVDAEITARLRRIYGSRAGMVTDIVQQSPELGAMLAPGSAAVAAEVVHAVRNEFARSVEDILLRRTMLGLDADLGAAVVSTTATLAAAELGWTATQTETQIQSYLCEIDRRRPPRLDHVQSAR